MARVIAITNNKGGVGKTHTTFHLAGALSDAERVLVVDLDPQANPTGLLLHESPRNSTYDVLVDQAPLRGVTRETSLAGVDIVSADELLEELGIQRLTQEAASTPQSASAKLSVRPAPRSCWTARPTSVSRRGTRSLRRTQW